MKRYLLLIASLVLVLQIPFTDAVPLTGNSRGAITLVEYYDYECPHCRHMAPVLEALQRQYPNLRIVYRVAPLLTANSRLVASLVLASEKQGKWQALHRRLMQSPDAPTPQDVLEISQSLGLNPQILLQTMRQPNIQHQLQQNIQLAQAHAVQGTLLLPTLVFERFDESNDSITLTGEQSYNLLSAIVRQLEQDHVQTIQNTKPTVSIVAKENS